MRKRQPVRVGQVLLGAATAGRLGLGLEGALAIAAWEAVAGRLATLCRAEGLRGGRLLLAARNPAAAQEVMLRREAIRRRINRQLGREVVREVHVACRPDGWEDPDGGLQPGRGTSAWPVVDPGEAQGVEREVAQIPDASARETARRAWLRAARLRLARMRAGWQPCSECGTPTDPREGRLCPFCRRAGSS